MRIEVANLTEAAARIARRLPENPGGTPVRIGWDGQRVAVFAGVYATPTKSLPHERLEFSPGMQPAEIETALAQAAARLLPALRRALVGHDPARVRTPRQHHWRRLAGHLDRD